MLWRSGRRSENIEDRRDEDYAYEEQQGDANPSGPRIRIGGKTLFVVIVVGLLMGKDPIQMLNLLSGLPEAPQHRPSKPTVSAPKNDEAAEFVSVILADTEDTWKQLLPSLGKHYREPHLVLFSQQINSACGFSTAATGPFYCPGDEKVYIDLSFFQTLGQLGAPGDFARAYVIGHEVGHHVQNILGISNKVHQLQQRLSAAQANALSVRLELQADCYAGVWAYHANKQRKILEAGDVEEGLQAAASIGDDRLQHNAGRRVSPESFTHGSSKQRVDWLLKGLHTGDVQACNTFS